LNLLFAASTAAQNSNQLTPLHIELLVIVDQPLMVAVPAQGITLVLLLQGWFTKRKNIGH
jgi:hypothetical protein